MSPKEGLVLVAAAMLAGVVFVESFRGALSSRAVVLLCALAALASIAALAHMFAR